MIALYAELDGGSCARVNITFTTRLRSPLLTLG